MTQPRVPVKMNLGESRSFAGLRTRTEKPFCHCKNHAMPVCAASTRQAMHQLDLRPRNIYSPPPTALAVIVVSLRTFTDHRFHMPPSLTIDVTRAVGDDLLDRSLLLQVVQTSPGERAVDLQSVDEHGNGDEAVRLHILLELLAGLLVENDGVLGLVLHCGECVSYGFADDRR